MSASVPTTEPTTPRAGDTWQWVRTLPDYPAPGWILTYTLYSAAAVLSLVAVADGADHRVDLPPATTAAYPAGRYDWVAHVSDGTDKFQVGAGVMTVQPAFPAAATAANLTTGTPAANNALLWTAVQAGAAGNAITLAVSVPALNNAVLSVAVSGTAIAIGLATGPTGLATSTAAEVSAAVAGTQAAALVTCVAVSPSSGAGVPVALLATALAGGSDAVTSYDGRSHARRMLDSINALLEGRATSGDLDTIRIAHGQRAVEYDLANLLKLRQQYAAAVSAEDAAAALARGESPGRLIQVRFTG